MEIQFQDVTGLFKSLGAARVFMFAQDSSVSTPIAYKSDLASEDGVAAAALAHEMVASSPQFWKTLLPELTEDLAGLKGVPLLPIISLAEAVATSAADLAVHDSNSFRIDRAREADLHRFLSSEMQMSLPLTLPPTFDPLVLMRTSFTPSRVQAPLQQRVLGMLDGAWWALQTVQAMESKQRLSVSPFGSSNWMAPLGDCLTPAEYEAEVPMKDKLTALRTVIKGDYEKNLAASHLFEKVKRDAQAVARAADMSSVLEDQKAGLGGVGKITSYKKGRGAGAFGK